MDVNTRGDERLMREAVGARDDNPRRLIDIIVGNVLSVFAMRYEKGREFVESSVSSHGENQEGYGARDGRWRSVSEEMSGEHGSTENERDVRGTNMCIRLVNSLVWVAVGLLRRPIWVDDGCQSWLSPW